MSKDRITLEEAMDYIDKYLTEAQNNSNDTGNGFQSPVIHKLNGKYKIKLSSEIINECNTALKIMKEYLQNVIKSKEYKNVIKELKRESIINDNGIHLDDQITKEIQPHGSGYQVDIMLSGSISQDLFYKMLPSKNAIYKLTDNAYNKLKNDNRIKSLKHFDFTYNGDDFFGWGVIFKLSETDYELVKIK